MNPLLARLASLRRKWRLLLGSRGIFALAATLIGAAVVAGVTDYYLQLPSVLRAVLLVGGLVGVAFIAFRFLIQPLAQPADDLALALRVEEAYPELNDALASTVEFLKQPEDVPPNYSPAMRQMAIAKAEQLAEACDFQRILDRRGLLWVALGALLAVAAAAHFLFRHGDLSRTALLRLGDPFGGHTWTRIDVPDAPAIIPRGQPLKLRVHFDGIIPANPRLEVEGLNLDERQRQISYDKAAGASVADLGRPDKPGKFRFRITGGDGSFPPGRNAWHEVEVRPPPSLAKLGGKHSPQLELHIPAYTELASPVPLSPGVGHLLELLTGTNVVLRAAADRPLAAAWIEYRPDQAYLPLLASLSSLGHDAPLNLLAAHQGGAQIWAKVPARLDAGGREIEVAFKPWTNGSYVLWLVDKDGLKKDFPYALTLKDDPLPIVQLLRPATSSVVLPDAEIGLQVSVDDEWFAVKSVHLEYRRRDGEGKWLDDGPQRLPLFDDQIAGRSIPTLFAGLAPGNLPTPPWRLRSKRMDLETRWPLRNQFKDGETLVVHIVADDFCDLFLPREVGRSHEIELRIVGRRELARHIDEGLAQAREELLRLQQKQEQALDLIRELQKQGGKLTQKEMQAIIEARALQKEIQERVGQRPDEGLRNELARLQQLTRDNKMPPTQAQDNIQTLRTELDRLAQTELQKLEPALADALKQAAQPQADAKKLPLDQVAKLQEGAKKTFDDLAKFLDPWAGMHLIKGAARDVLDKQREIQKETLKTLQKQDQLAKEILKPAEAKKAHEAIADDLLRQAEAQKNLAKKAQDLMNMIDKAQARRAQDKDKQAADQLQQAHKAGNQVPDASKQIGEELAKKNPRLNQAVDKQGDNVQKMEKLLAALEEKKEDDLDRLQRKRKNADKNLNKVEDLAKEQDRLQKKVREAAQEKDEEKRAERLKELAKEQDELKKKAQDEARELARLQEDQAARAMNRAAQDMERAAAQLQDGENPAEAQQEAMERLEDAQAKLEQSEEELAREQLAKIADRLKGLKERQDAFLERSKDLHKKVLAKKRWSQGFLESLAGDAKAQEGLAQEARSLKEKIKEAVVFEHVLEKAAKAMDDAAGVMKERKEEGRLRQIDEMEKEELADEERRGGDTQRLQQQAAQRLDRLLESLKNELARKPRPKRDNNQQAKKEGMGEEPGGLKGPGDGIPPMAQLKALRAEQLDLNEQTKELVRRHPDVNNLPDNVRRLLAELSEDQARLHRLFEEMTRQKKAN